MRLGSLLVLDQWYLLLLHFISGEANIFLLANNYCSPGLLLMAQSYLVLLPSKPASQWQNMPSSCRKWWSGSMCSYMLEMCRGSMNDSGAKKTNGEGSMSLAELDERWEGRRQLAHDAIPLQWQPTYLLCLLRLTQVNKLVQVWDNTLAVSTGQGAYRGVRENDFPFPYQASWSAPPLPPENAAQPVLARLHAMSRKTIELDC